MTRRQSLFFTAPQTVEIRETAVPLPAADELLIKTIVSGISPGTEMLMFQGEFPPDIPADSEIAALSEPLRYPFKYGYSAVGRVVDCGGHLAKSEWLDQRVFAFQPHDSHFVTKPENVMRVPEHLASETAVFLPNMETAVSLVMDGQPMIGEQVLVVGQGVVGLLTTAVLAQFPLAGLVTADLHALRRDWSKKLGATTSYNPQTLVDKPVQNVDLSFELSGNPHGLNVAIQATGSNGRIVVGSWYGQKTAPINLGDHFHRSQMRLISSQVSRIAPQWHGRWNKARRFQLAWQQLERLQSQHLITHHYSLTDAQKAYDQIANHPDQTLQVLITY